MVDGFLSLQIRTFRLADTVVPRCEPSGYPTMIRSHDAGLLSSNPPLAEGNRLLVVTDVCPLVIESWVEFFSNLVTCGPI